jgi:REP element-mobilizing transposase RayT
MSKLIRESQNVSILLYHFVCPAKYRRAVFDRQVDEVLKDVCLEIAKRYQIEFIEIGTDKNHVDFLIQSVPTYSPTQIIRIVKSLTAREIFRRAPEVKKQLWGGEFWSDRYFVGTVSRQGNEETIKKHVQQQGKAEEYQQLHIQQLRLFE